MGFIKEWLSDNLRYLMLAAFVGCGLSGISMGVRVYEHQIGLKESKGNLSEGKTAEDYITILTEEATEEWQNYPLADVKQGMSRSCSETSPESEPGAVSKKGQENVPDVNEGNEGTGKNVISGQDAETLIRKSLPQSAAGNHPPVADGIILTGSIAGNHFSPEEEGKAESGKVRFSAEAVRALWADDADAAECAAIDSDFLMNGSDKAQGTMDTGLSDRLEKPAVIIDVTKPELVITVLTDMDYETD